MAGHCRPAPASLQHHATASCQVQSSQPNYSNFTEQAYSPLAKGRKLEDPVVGGIAARLGVTPAQVLIR